MHMGRYYENLDYLLTNRAVVRILMFESRAANTRASFPLHETDGQISNPIYRTLQSTDEDFDYNEDTIFFKFFFSWIPDQHCRLL